MAPGPTWVPIVPPTVKTGRLSACSIQMSLLSLIYFCSNASLKPVYPKKYGISKSIPPALLICSIRRLLPCLEPLAFPRIITSPSATPTTGLMDRTLPAKATVFEMRPPLFRYSRVSTDAEICAIIEAKEKYEEKYHCHIPLIVAGGIFDHQDVEHVLSPGADGVQVASRFVATYECDASDAYKEAYISAGEEDVEIIKSPVGMPGRALCNAFIQNVRKERQPIKKCYQCLQKCDPTTIPYCITKALIEAVKGKFEEGFIFCGANVGRIDRMMSVHELMKELTE